MLDDTKKNEKYPSSLIICSCLCLAVTLCSSAGSVFDSLTTVKDVPPFLAAFWRLLFQNIVQFLPFLLSLKDAWREDKKRYLIQHWNATNDNNDGAHGMNVTGGDLSLQVEVDNDGQSHHEEKYLLESNSSNQTIVGDEPLILPRYLRSLPLLIGSGFALGVHFSMWVYSLRYTSLTHSLLWVSMGPIVLNGGSWTLYITSKILTASPFVSLVVIFRKPSWMETAGAILGFMGAAVMLLDTKRNQNENYEEYGNGTQKYSRPPTIHGDIAAFIGAVAVCIYLVIGKSVRSWLPIWLYVFPVIGFASLTCLIFALFDDKDPSTWSGMTNSSIFGLFSKEYILYAMYLGIGPGIFGHTMINTLLRYISPLVVSTALLSEPIIGSIIGHLFGLQSMPTFYTWVGGMILMFGLVFVVFAENQVDEKTKNDDTEEQHQDTNMNKQSNNSSESQGLIRNGDANSYGSFQDHEETNTHAKPV